MGNKLIYYLTYQDFPAQTANSQQTISTCKYFVRNKYRVVLFFPLRSKNSSEDLNLLKKQYEFSDENFNVSDSDLASQATHKLRIAAKWHQSDLEVTPNPSKPFIESLKFMGEMYEIILMHRGNEYCLQNEFYPPKTTP